jgi:hypothetical protein
MVASSSIASISFVSISIYMISSITPKIHIFMDEVPVTEDGNGVAFVEEDEKGNFAFADCIDRSHNFASATSARHSLSNWAGPQIQGEPEDCAANRGTLGHSRIQTPLDLYTDEDRDEMIAAQEKFLDAVGFERETVQ